MTARSDGRTIVRVTYSKAMDRVRIIFDDRTIYVVPRGLIEGLALASAQELRRIEIAGSDLHWPLIGVTHSVPKLLSGVYGSRKWMATLERAPRRPRPGEAMFVSPRRIAGARVRRFFDEKIVMANRQATRSAKRHGTPPS